MLVYETKITKDDGTEFLRVMFNHHKRAIFTKDIPLQYERCSALRIAKAKEAAIDEFLTTFEGKSYTRKEVLKAYSKVDEYFEGVYKKEFPHGGWRQGGRPKGTKTSDRTERLQQSISRDEKRFLVEALENYRARKAQTEEEMREALAPYLRQIDENFGDNDEARQKWRARVSRMNPALYPQLLEHFKLFGIEGLPLLGAKSSQKGGNKKVHK